tara:strand:+ start:166 stop:333 length:168 start_codon:yes stop_codon:yes gene_type:complete
MRDGGFPLEIIIRPAFPMLHMPTHEKDDESSDEKKKKAKAARALSKMKKGANKCL